MSAITKSHQAFARAVVALAREHQMDSLQLKFNYAFDHPEYSWGNEVTMSWKTGRHGDQSQISLESRAALGIDETEAAKQGGESNAT